MFRCARQGMGLAALPRQQPGAVRPRQAAGVGARANRGRHLKPRTARAPALTLGPSSKPALMRVLPVQMS